MNGADGSSDSAKITVYKGRPMAFGTSQEVTAWKQFLRWLCPWLRGKLEQGENYLQAQVDKERAEAERTRAEAAKLDAETRQINVNTLLTVVQSVIAAKGCPSAAAARAAEAIIDEINELRVVHGVRIAVMVETPEARAIKPSLVEPPS